MASDPPPSGHEPDRGGREPREPRDYRPDLRPMLILAGLIAFVVIAWILLTPLILP